MILEIFTNFDSQITLKTFITQNHPYIQLPLDLVYPNYFESLGPGHYSYDIIIFLLLISSDSYKKDSNKIYFLYIKLFIYMKLSQKLLIFS